MKKRIRLAGILLTLALLINCLAAPVTAQAAVKKSVKITSVKSNTSVYVGTTKSLGVKANTKSSVTYTTSDSGIAKVSRGKLYAYKPGKVKIMIKAAPKSKKYKTTYKSIYVKVLPKKAAVSAVKRSGKYITMSVKAARGAQGYQYQYATNSKMKSAKTKTTSARTYKFTASRSRTYYVRVRSYAKSGGKVYYSGWGGVRKVSKAVEPSKPDVPEEPPVHIHKWTMYLSGEPVDWNVDGPLEEETDEIAEDRNGKKIGINMCARCYAYFGHPDNDEWIGRFWDHCDNVHDAGYCTYPVYAFYDAYFCEGCGRFTRGRFSEYGYYDYSNGIKSICLTPEQVEELNLPLRKAV